MKIMSVPSNSDPHAAPPIWQTEGTAKRAAVRRMFGEIAGNYDRFNGIVSLRLHGRWRATAVRMLNLRPGQVALDVCSGTGDFLPPLRRAVGDEGRVVGVDFCGPMLGEARRKGVPASLAMGDACRLPVGSEKVDAVSVGWGLRNVPDLDAAHREIFRVLRPGGRFASIDMAHARSGLVRGVARAVQHALLPRLGALFGSKEAYTYLPKSIDTFSTREQLADSMRRAGFVEVVWKDLFFGTICIHGGKRP